MPKYQSNYVVPPLSRKEIREFAESVRKMFGIYNNTYFPVTRVLEVLGLMEINFEIIAEMEWLRTYGGETQAFYSLSEHTIKIRQSVYDCDNKDHGRDRFTIAHEIAHALLLNNHSIKVAKNRNVEDTPIWCNPEWQADCLAGELLVPYHLCKDMTIEEIMEKCKVSFKAASYQKSKF